MRCFHLFLGSWTRSRVLSVAAGALATVASLAAPSFAGTITFGPSGNTFDMTFVTIGNPGNAADTDPSARPVSTTLGRVTYTYDIGKFEVSRDMINKYNANFGTGANLEITLHDWEAPDNYPLVIGGNGVNKPATGVSWNEAARFVNWLNTSQGFAKAYKFVDGSGVNDNILLWQSGDAGYDENNKCRNSLAKYVLPSTNEWYKAAYYDPNKTGGAGYWDYATRSDSAPVSVASGTGTGVNGHNEAVYSQGFDQGPADVTQAGGLSPYSVMGLGGNVYEWQESSSDLNYDAFSGRGSRGGRWDNDPDYIKSSYSRSDLLPIYEFDDTGFRVASLSSSAPPAVPEPSMMVIGMVFGLGGLAAKRRLKK